ncbi:MAG TPA: YebC/PmpR family DNA-binding transcriptional regulator [Gammaproteobacteria bacterium]|jgi:YebC/PmpR family DNA-binding regulatory protein|nr:YebC/PmpR family DNA-binding transcriptional regulator [Gammaproteobacteria bacterium]HIN13327.1 YebC/PmpR family DNA-binding transcriptional regulator [Gammaproteobacteria bacterium]
MSGHSKWANIQHRKGRQDKKRGKLFSKLIREVTVAAKYGSDPSANPRLRAAIDKAKSQSMPKENIDRAISRGSGEEEGFNFEEVTYEGYGPGGAAILIECMTDNRNRTVAEVRHALSKFGGNLGSDGSVSYLFEKVGLMTLTAVNNRNQTMEIAIDAGAEDIESNEDGSIEIITNPTDFLNVKESLVAEGINPEIAEVTMRASVSVSIGVKHAESMLKLLDVLEDLDDVQAVHSNAEIPDEVLDRMG